MLIVAEQSNRASAVIWPNPATSNTFLNAFAQPLPEMGGNHEESVHRASAVGCVRSAGRQRTLSRLHENRIHRSFSMPFDTDDPSSARLQTVAGMAVHGTRKPMMGNHAADTRSAMSPLTRTS